MKKLYNDNSERFELISKSTFTYHSSIGATMKHWDEYVFIRIPDTQSESPVVETGLVHYVGYDEKYITIEVVPCSINLLHVNVIDIEVLNYKKDDYDRREQTYNFRIFLHSKDYKSKIYSNIEGTVADFAEYCKILNYYVENDFDIENINWQKLQIKTVTYFQNLAIKKLAISQNNKYSDFLDILLSSIEIHVYNCSRSSRYQSYFFTNYDTLTLSTSNKAFAEILENNLKMQKKTEGSNYVIEIKSREDVSEADYNSYTREKYPEEGTFTSVAKGKFKKEIIDRIINDTHRDFPSEMDVICRNLIIN